MNEYNLLDEPWLPVADFDGNNRRVGLLEAIADAPNIIDIIGYRVERLPVLRILMAIVHRSIHDWNQTWEAGEFGPEVSKYLESVRDRFYLFGDQPFMQATGLAEVEIPYKDGSHSLLSDEPNPISAMALSRFGIFTQMAPNAKLSPADAAWVLIGEQFYAVTGNMLGLTPSLSFGAGLGAGCNGVTPLGDSLFSTIMLNIIALEKEEGDAPSWERDDAGVIAYRNYTGPLDLLTFESRHVELVRDEDGLVVGFYRMPKFALTPEGFSTAFGGTDPHTLEASEAECEKRRKSAGHDDFFRGVKNSLEPHPDGLSGVSALWNEDKMNSARSKTIQAIANLDTHDDRFLAIETAILHLDKSKASGTTEDIVGLPLSLLSDYATYNAVSRVVAKAEKELWLCQSAYETVSKRKWDTTATWAKCSEVVRGWIAAPDSTTENDVLVEVLGIILDAFTKNADGINVERLFANAQNEKTKVTKTGADWIGTRANTLRKTIRETDTVGTTNEGENL